MKFNFNNVYLTQYVQNSFAFQHVINIKHYKEIRYILFLY